MKNIILSFFVFTILILLCNSVYASFNPDWSTSGTVDLFYGESLDYSPSDTGNGAGYILDKVNFRHRFTDAQILNNVIFKNTWTSSLSYTKNDITSFTATVDDIYYGSGTISLVEQLDEDVRLMIDFVDINNTYANTLTGIEIVALSYDSSIWSGVNVRSGDMHFCQYSSPYGLSSAKPTVMVSSNYDAVSYAHFASLDANTVQVSYNIEYSNNYIYEFNESYNISTLNITRSSSSSYWQVYDSEDTLYFDDDGYSTTAIEQSFIRSAGVYANITYNVDGGTSILKALDINGTITEGPADPSEPFIYNITTELDEYSPGDTVNVTYTTDQKGTIQVVKTISGDIYHSIGFVSGATNATWDFYIAENEPYGLYDVYLLDSSNTILDSVRYSLLPTTSSLDILQSSVDLHETFVVFAQTVNESILSIEDPDGVEVWNESIGALMYDYIYYTPTIKQGIYTAYLYDYATLNDTVMVFLADPPIIDDPLDPETNGSIVVEDVLDPDESMTEYYNEKFRDFAPTIWGFFMLMCLLFLMSILTSFNSGSKRR